MMKKILLIVTLFVTVFLMGAKAQDCTVTLPFNDSFESSTLDPCWTVVLADTNSTLPQYGVTNEDASDGLQSLMLLPIYSSNYDLYLITPELPVSGTKSVSFDHRGYWSAETFVVGYSTTTNDISAFTWGETVSSPAVDDPWNHYLNVAIPGDAKYVAIHHTSSNGFALYIDNFVIEEASACMAPTDLAVIQVSGTSADLTWSQSSDNLDITLYYAQETDTVATVVSYVFLTNGIYTLEGLTPNSQYSWMLSVICDDDTLYSNTSSFTTPCDIISSLPYIQDFNDVATNGIPSCWTTINPYNGYPKVTTSHSHSGKSLEFRCYSTSSDGVYAVLPPFATDLSELQISFWTRREGASSGTLSVGYMTDLNNTSTFVPVTSISAAQIGDNSYHFFNIPFNNVATDLSSSYFIAFKYITSAAWHWYVDDVTVEEIPDCTVPYDLTVNSVTESSANLSWTGNSDSYIVYYKTTADTSWMMVGNALLDSLNGFNLPNLLPNTNYQWYVAAVCDDATTVESVTTSSFKTNCGTYEAPFNETFNSAAALPDCWEMYSGLASDVFNGTPLSSTSSGWGFSNYNIFGQNHASLNIQGSSCHYWLVTPNIDLEGIASPMLTFDLALTSHNNTDPVENTQGQPDDKFMMMISTDNGATWSANNAFVWNNDNTGDYSFNQITATGQTIHLALNDYAGQSIRITFYGESSVNNGDNDLHIDNMSIIEAPACMSPSLVTASDITFSSANISWTENGNATAWVVEYGLADFEPGTGSTIQINDTTSVTLTNLMDNTEYRVDVSAVCADGNYSNSASKYFTTPLAPVTIPYSTDFSDTADRNWLLNNGTNVNWWTMGTVNGTNALYVTCDSVLQPAQYTITTTSVISAVKSLLIGTTEEVKISFDINIGGEGQFDFIKLFFSPDSITYPAMTTTFNVSYCMPSYSSYAYNFTDYLSYSTYHQYPYKFNLTNGNTVHIDAVMPNPYTNPTSTSVANLVFLWRNDYMSGTQPGAIISNVSVTPVSCTRPVNLLAGNITENSADISWLPSGTETAWNVQYKADTASTWTAISVSSTTYTLTGLLPETTYNVRVQANCGEGETSLWTAVETFTTLSEYTPEPCEVPTGLHTTGIENHAISIAWDADDNVSSWNILYRLAGGDPPYEPTILTSSTNAYTITGLTGLNTYEIQVQADCGDGNLSDWSSVLTEQTTNVGIEDHLSSHIALYPNPANDVVNVQCTMSNVQLKGIEVIDIYGKVVCTVVGANNYSPLPTRINVSGLANGMYFVRVTTEEGTVTKTFVKK